MGPVDGRRTAAASLLDQAQQLANTAGVTRLADITRLDRIGLPVWQAVRPMSRALSVHQGKGARASDAKLGALLEAAESDAAERFEADGPVCTWHDLDADERPHDLADFARNRNVPPAPDQAIQWTRAERLDGSTCWVPFDCVSLDFTLPEPSLFERSSAGLATGTSQEDARRTALYELIERDALRAFLGSDMIARLQHEIMPGTVPYDWFADLDGRIVAAGGSLRVFHLPAVGPAFAASIDDQSKDARPYRAIVGHAAHPVAEIALFKAVAEAVQSRLTFISASRDDCLPSLYDKPERAVSFALAPPPNPGVLPSHFDAAGTGPTTVEAIAEALSGAGFENCCFVPILEREGFFVERAFVTGMGSLARERRA